MSNHYAWHRKGFPIPATRGRGLATPGWQKPLEEVLLQFEGELASLESRLRDGASTGIPSAYTGERLFAPEQTSFALDTVQNGVSSNLVNFVLKDGVTYDIPVIFPGPGTFRAKYLNVAIYKRLIQPSGVVGWVNYDALWSTEYRSAPPNAPPAGNPWTTKFSLYPQQPVSVLNSGVNEQVATIANALNFGWNVSDPRSGRRLANDFMSNVLLRPALTAANCPWEAGFSETPTGQGALGYINTLAGRFYEFSAPWEFERDSQVTFHFRPLNPILQFDSSIAGDAAAVGLGFDDRENGVRNQSVLVQVEFIGSRYETDQDIVDAGAASRR